MSTNEDRLREALKARPPFAINLMKQKASQVEVDYRSVEPEQPKVFKINLMNDEFGDNSIEENDPQAKTVLSQIDALQMDCPKQKPASLQKESPIFKVSDALDQIHDHHFESNAFPESMKAKVRSKQGERSPKPLEEKKRDSKTQSFLSKLGNLIPGSKSPKKDSRGYNSLEKQIEDNQIMVEVNSPTRKIELVKIKDEEMNQQNDKNEDDQMACLMEFLDELGPEVKEAFILKMVELGQQPDVTRSKFNEEVNKWFIQMQGQGVIQKQELFESIESIFKPMSRLFDSIRKLAVSDVQKFSQIFRTAMQNISERKSPSMFLNPKFIALHDKISKRNSIQSKIYPKIPKEFEQASVALPAFLELMLRETTLDPCCDDLQSELKEISSYMASLKETSDLFFNDNIADKNYLFRDKLLYKPTIKLFVPKARHSVVYYWKEFAPFNDTTSYGWPKLIQPLVGFMKRINILKKGKKKEVVESITESEQFELPTKVYERFLKFTIKFGISVSLSEFFPLKMQERFEQSFNNYEDKTNVQKLPSTFTKIFLKDCILPATLLNLDLSFYKVAISLYESILKLQALTLLRTLE